MMAYQADLEDTVLLLYKYQALETKVRPAYAKDNVMSK